MSLMLELLVSGFWLPKDNAIKSHFVIRESDFNRPTNILILKSIGYKNNKMYINGREQIISNLLRCSRSDKYYLLTLQVVAAFCAHNDKHGHDYTVVDRLQLANSFQEIIPLAIDSSLPSCINNVFDYLVERDVFRISSTDEGDATKLYLSTKGNVLWELMGKNSVLLEMFRDDLWLKKIEHNAVSARHNGHESKFIDILKLASDYLDYEKGVVEEVSEAGGLSSLRELLGEKLPSIHIAGGVINSVRQYYNSERLQRPHKVDENFKKLITSSKKLKSLYLEEK